METRRYRLLGGLEVVADGERLDLGTRKQRALLASLLLAEGNAVSTDRLIEDLWGEDAPDRAEASIQSYVSVLRRTLEPDRAPRQPATVLVTVGTGYALKAARTDVDAWRFADRLEQARARHTAGDLRATATTLRNALAEYAPLLPEFEGETFREEATRALERVHLAALELSYEVRLELGEHRALAADLETAVQRHPLHEGLWALLATARYRNGRQSDALRAVADARRLLAEEIGVDPGPRLRQLELDLLAQAAHLDPPAVEAPPAPPADEVGRLRGPASPPAAPDLVGRVDELNVLHEAVLRAVGGHDGLVIVEGDPGVGKTALVEEATSRAIAQGGLRVYWGRCVDGDGAPAMWPWVQILTQVLHELEDDERAELLDTELGRLVTSGREVKPVPTILPDAGARFRLFDQAGELLDEVAARGPIVVVLDDLQWADSASLMLLTHMASRRPGRAVFVAALRPLGAAPPREIAAALAALSRLPAHRRIRVGPLNGDDVGELISRETGGSRPTPDVVRGVLARTDGNPFFVRELSRLLQSEGQMDAAGLASAGVPSGVRDVVRGRLEGIGTPATEVLQLASVIGKQVDLGLLARAAGVDVGECLERLEPAEALAMLTPVPDDPYSFRFAHDLVRESVMETVPPLRLGRLHLRVADALESSGRDAADRLAHHLWSAGPLADRTRTARALLAAGQGAVRSYAYDDAERQLTHAAELARAAGDADLELEAVALLTSVIGVRLGYVGAALELMERAEHLAVQLGRDRQAGDFLYSRWAAYSQRVELVTSGRLATRLRERGESSEDPVIQLYGAHASGVDHWDNGFIADSHRDLTRAYDHFRTLRREQPRDDALLRHDLQLLTPAFYGYMTAFTGDVEGGRRVFDELERDLPDQPYPLVVWGSFSCSAAAICGIAPWAAEAGRRVIDADPHLTYVFLGTYARIQYWWAQAMLGRPDEAVDEIRSLLKGLPSDSPRSGESTWHALLGEALLVGGRLEEADEALDASMASMEQHGQRYSEPLTLLVRARVRHAAGDAAAVGPVLDQARALAEDRGAHVLTRRVDAFAAELG